MNMRIKKKQLKAKLELENQILDAEIAALKTSAKRKEAKLRQMRAQIRLAESLRDGVASHSRIKTPQKSYSYLKNINTFSDADDKALVGALIKKYNDYIDKGFIKPKTFVDNYEQASWMANEVLNSTEMKAAVKQADTWLKRRNERVAERMANDPGIWEIDF